MTEPAGRESSLIRLARAISIHDLEAAGRLLEVSPELAKAALTADTQFEWPRAAYIGDTALHIAAAVYAVNIVETLIDLGANVAARNRRGAAPLHYAAVGSPGAWFWNPTAQTAVIEKLIHAGADPNVVDKSGVTPLHRAVRTRATPAVKALLEQGANVHATNKSGSTPMLLAKLNTGRGGTGSAVAKAQQYEIQRLLQVFGAQT